MIQEDKAGATGLFSFSCLDSRFTLHMRKNCSLPPDQRSGLAESNRQDVT